MTAIIEGPQQEINFPFLFDTFLKVIPVTI